MLSDVSPKKSKGEYPMAKPNEQLEQYRLGQGFQTVFKYLLTSLDLQHQIFNLTLNDRLFTAPLDNQLKSVLDLGCGTGVWALEIANSFPSAQVVATDLTPPNIAAPPNVTFVKTDIEEPWPFEWFSFIHGRMLMSAIRDWPTFLAQCWEHLEPGGWLELLEVCHPYRSEDPQVDSSSSPFLRFGEISNKAWELAGRDFLAGPKQLQRLHDLGFQNVHEEQFIWPVGGWGSTDRERRMGEMIFENYSNHISSATQVLMHDPGIDKEEAKHLIEETRKDIERNCHTRRYFFDV